MVGLAALRAVGELHEGATEVEGRAGQRSADSTSSVNIAMHGLEGRTGLAEGLEKGPE